jgi:hypothetical protein
MKKNEIMNLLVDLAIKLSPENLTCDGELSKSQVQIRLRQIRAEWKQLEKQLRRSITESEVWVWYSNNKNRPSRNK